MHEFPRDRRAAILESFPDSGLAWLDAYPELLKDCLDHWQVSITGTETSGLPINMIYFVETRSLDQRVLKIGHPHPEQKTEILALKHYNGKYSVQLLDVHREAILLDRITPGTTLRAESSEANNALMLFVDLPQSISSKDQDLFPSYSSWMEKAFSEYRSVCREKDLIGEYLLEAEKLYRDIDDGETYLLHGDLHHENILLNEKNGWTAIDPKGVVGPKIMECGRYIHNFMEDTLNKELDNKKKGDKEISEFESKMLAEIMKKRISLINDVTHYEPRYLAMVAFIDITLSTCWTINAGGKPDNGLQRVKACSELLKHFHMSIDNLNLS